MIDPSKLMSHRVFPSRCPVPALFRQMFPLLELLSSEIAGNQRVTAGTNAIGEVHTGHTSPAALPTEQLTFVNKGPLLHPLVPQ